MTIGPVNYIRQYQLNFMLIDGRKLIFLYRANKSLHFNNTKKIVVYSPIEPNQF